ncbi:hypothetical protein [Pseudomonas koreensis]|uniref:hypothetical protein n=1 Tax=Pseudomonas koreensis TaxID=198620 RepID=UPI00078CCEA9|nr:hypothetical protein [Pseudomonas koreensis]AMT88364.1 hypothetical protein AYO71_12705 [Pseudomonas koreensis]
MKIQFNNNVVIGSKSLIKAPDDMPLDFSGSGNKLFEVENVFDFYSRSNPEDLGLKPDVPRENLESLVSGLVAIRDEPVERKRELIDGSGIAAWLKAGISLADLMSRLIALCDKAA